ncbi:hypothetical protein J2Y69_002804 [Microbacterium resistens]|uniref:Uncharacterized protein n=1 Tax=Microbacterium resistens TaxID=156977 RepID=A0ABU1SF02_9MICO|nr:hypothetical protein [Microbacterium resistens]MDR6868190.1 hypothetical protein [Microbacterium resistens]
MSQHQAGDRTSDREQHPPRRGGGIGALTLAQFFVGGLVLFVAAMILLISSTAEAYDGIGTIIGWNMGALFLAVSSMIAAMIVGLPLRLVPALRSRWLANGGITVAGAGLGFVACAIIIAIAPMAAETDEWRTPVGRDTNLWALLTAWALFAISVAHFVWPSQWRRRARCR